jgi:predicted cupin superfamily sugar epimerase
MPAPSERGLETLAAEEVAERLGLTPHPEGGFFRETYRALAEVPTDGGARPLATAILYLLTESAPSRFHRLRSDELWLYHAGAPAWLVLLPPYETAAVVKGAPAREHGDLPARQVIGPDDPQSLVPARWWMGASTLTGDLADWGTGWVPERRWTRDRRTAPGPRWTLVTCVVTPGFDFADLEMADRQALVHAYPQARRVIEALT